MSGLEGAAFAALIAGAGMQVYGGYQQKKAYESQARQTALQGRVEAAKAKMQTAQILRESRAALATTAAASYAGGFSGLLGTAQDRVVFGILSPAVSEYKNSIFNEDYILEKSQAQADDLKKAGRSALNQGIGSALMTLGSAGFSAYQNQGPGKTPSGSTRPRTVSETPQGL